MQLNMYKRRRKINILILILILILLTDYSTGYLLPILSANSNTLSFPRRQDSTSHHCEKRICAAEAIFCCPTENSHHLKS
jgi:hypothetical protein